ncbi:MAG: sll1863 family stress response protein, partial [Deferrisomatales bacterium]
MMEKRRAFSEKLGAQLKEWNVQIALLNAKADTAKAEAKVEYYATIDCPAKTRSRAFGTSGTLGQDSGRRSAGGADAS